MVRVKPLHLQHNEWISYDCETTQLLHENCLMRTLQNHSSTRDNIVRIIILPCPNWSILPNLGVFLVIIESRVPLGPLGLMERHVSVTRVWVTQIEANFHLMHLHALF